MIDYMLQKQRKEWTKVCLFALFMSFGTIVQAQTEIELKRYIDHWYFQDIALERGLYMAMTMSDNLSDGRITSIYSSYFLNHWFGLRPGVSLITDLRDSQYLKIPCLFAVRSPTFHMVLEPKSFREFLWSLFLCIMPTRWEVNVGPSLGYVWNNKRSLASSIDCNFRMGFQFWRIGINGNMGFNYLWTKNFVDRNIIAYSRQIRPAWFANLSVGASFRF
jgi:hypothetical protein